PRSTPVRRWPSSTRCRTRCPWSTYSARCSTSSPAACAHPAKESDMSTDVVVVGGGPNGLMLAGELALAGVRALVLEKLPAPSDEPKANGLLGQVVQLIDRRGLYERLTGQPGPPGAHSTYFMFA